MRNRHIRPSLALPFLFLGSIFACSSGVGPGTDVIGDFESDDPNADSSGSGGSRNEMSAGAADSSTAPVASEDSKAAERAVEEADILKVEGDKLFAISRTGGLSIVDISNPDKLKLLGRHRVDAIPFEMYVRDGVVYAMLNSFGKYVKGADGYYQYVQTSEMLALDVSNPASIKEIASYDLPGDVSDSRLVGDVMYVVTFENGYCYGCQTTPSTTVTSFKVSPGSISSVDQLRYSSPNKSYSWWKRSITANNQRMYIAGPEWSWNGNSQPQSIIQVVDISNPTGKMVKGADVQLQGQITNRWQMDEYNGHLRVVSQRNGSWWGSGQHDPIVQTFQVNSAQSVVPVGQTTLKLPMPESLRSVRFDGARGYAITAQQTDPLFTIDLSNPALPKQMGELVMPGFVYHMEPRGDRLIGLGYDQGNADGALHVSLFDVADLANPKMIKRVNFGKGWAQLAEDQDRIHKSFQVLDDAGLMLVPFASYGRWWGGNCEKGQSGIQLIDFSRDSLTLRGVAPQHGQPRRAFLAKDRLFGISDRNVSVFSIQDRDKPAQTTELGLANPAYTIKSFGSHVAQLTNDWWTGEALLSFTPKANADIADYASTVSLRDMIESDEQKCATNSYQWTSWYQARIFVDGTKVYVAVPTYGYTYDPSGRNGKSTSSLLIGIVDASDITKPKLVGKTTIQSVNPNSGYYGGFYDDYAYYSGNYGSYVVGAGQAVVQKGSTLAFIESGRDYSQNGIPSPLQRAIHVIDLADVTAPKEKVVTLGASYGATPLLLQGNTVLTTKWTDSQQTPGKVRFFAERLDITDPKAPVLLPNVNIPGSLLSVDESTGRFVTVGYKRFVVPSTNYQGCYTAFNARAYFDYQSKQCVFVERDFNLLDVKGNYAYLRNTVALPEQNLAGIRANGDKIFVTLYADYDYNSGVSESPSGGGYSTPKIRPGSKQGLLSFGGIKQGTLARESFLEGEARWPLAIDGSRVAVYREGGWYYSSQGVAIYDMNGTPRLLGEANLRGYGYSSDVLLEGNQAIAALGEFGLQTIALKP
ncbi:MAG: beta-propeller domain-containing protein [Polyangiaceae bacterium]|nr:beta-propeller domain-containing protein [Polyangiaceae bacterium]